MFPHREKFSSPRLCRTPLSESELCLGISSVDCRLAKQAMTYLKSVIAGSGSEFEGNVSG